MPCRVGITTDPGERRARWQSQVVGFINWKILGSFMSKSEAQQYETRYAKKYGCRAAPGGPDVPGPWYVYRFDYTRTRV
jgi:hypothetical protein